MQLPAEARQLVHDAVLAACDAADGVTDGVVGDPERCDFDPAVLECDGNGGEGCLSAAQVRSVRMLYASPENPQAGRPITGLLPGSELGWTDLGWTRSARATGLEQFRYLTFADPEWTIDRFNFETDIVARRGAGRRHPERARPEPAAVLRPRREAALVPRLGRPADLSRPTSRSTTGASST